jgi:WD40 repeat protein
MKAGLLEMLRVVREEEPPKPSMRLTTSEQLPSIAANRGLEPKKLSGLVKGELDWIVMKALEKDRARRYETANGLAMDVQRYLGDEAVQACPPSTTYRFRKFARRHKTALVTAAIVTTSLVLGLGVSIWQATLAHRAEVVARNQWKIAREQKALAEDGERAARRNLHTTNMNLADVAWQRGDVSRMLTLLEAQRPAAGQDDLRGFEWYYLWALCHRGLLGTLHCASTVRCVGFSGDGRTLASGSDDGTIRLWDLPAKTVRATWSQNRSSVASVAFSPDAKTLCAGRADGKVELWDVPSQQLRVTLHGHTEPVGAVSFSADGQTLFTGDEAGIRLWNLATGREKATINTGEGSGAPAISPDGSTVASGTFQKVQFWDVKTGKARTVEDDHRWRVLAVAFSPDGKFVASGASDEATVRIWEVATGKTHAVLRGHTKEVVSVAFSPDGKQVASASSDGTARVWDLATGKRRSYGHTHSVCSVAFSPDGKTLASAGHDRAIKLWDLEVQRTRLALPPQNGLVWAAKFSPDGRLLATASHHSAPALWDARTGKRRSEFAENGDGAPACLAFSPDGRWLATGGHDQTVRVCDVKTGQAHVALPTFMAHIHGLEFSPDGRSLGASGTTGEIRVWDTTTWQVRTTFQHAGEACWSLSFSPDSARVATKGHTSIRIWNAAGINTASLPCEDCADTTGCAMAFSPDGGSLAALSGGYWSHVTGTDVKLWDLSTNQERQSIPADTITGSAQCMALSSDWKYLAVGSTDGNVRLFDLATGQERATFSGHQDEVTTIAFSPDGRSMATGGWDGTVELWHTASEADVLAQSSRDELLLTTR